MTDAETTHGLLRELIAEIRRLTLSLNGASKPMTRTDLQRLATLLPAIESVVGDHPFTARELAKRQSLQGLTRSLSVKQIGRLLSRAEQRVIEGLVVERLGVEGNVILWRVSPSSGVSNLEKP